MQLPLQSDVPEAPLAKLMKRPLVIWNLHSQIISAVGYLDFHAGGPGDDVLENAIEDVASGVAWVAVLMLCLFVYVAACTALINAFPAQQRHRLLLGL